MAYISPVGLEDNFWHFLGLFIAVIMAVILQVMPLAVCMIAIAIVALSGITTTQSSVRATYIKTLEGIVLKIILISIKQLWMRQLKPLFYKL
ncbi:hypothetical protein ACOTV8_06800 [Campylobacter jejuni]